MKGIVWRAMDVACLLTRHVGCCGLLNDRWAFGWDEARQDARRAIPNPLFRVWLWANDIHLGVRA